MTIETYLSDLGSYLASNSLGTVGTDIHYIGLNPAAANDITLTPYEGAEFNSIVSGEINPYSPSLSILVRNSDAATGLSKATAIYKLLRNIANQQIGNTYFFLIEPRSPPGYVSKVNHHHIFSINFNLLIR